MARTGYNIYKSFFPAFAVLAGALLAFTGCNNDPGVEPEPPKGKTIEFFSTAASYESRAASGSVIEDGDSSFPDGRSFGVYAYQVGFDESVPGKVEVFKNPATSSATAFPNTEVSTSDGVAGYSPKVLWPHLSTGRSLRFFAYYPWTDQNRSDKAITVTQSAAAEQVSIGYKMSGDPSKHIDLMHWMGPRNTTENTVNVELGHSLARLKFQARMQLYSPGTRIEVTNIEIGQAVSEGTLNISPSGDRINAVWNLNSTSKTSLAMTQANGLSSGRYLTGEYGSVLESDESDMLVIPQNVGGMVMKVTALIDGVQKVYTKSLTGTADWTMNESVTYRLSFDWDGLSVDAVVAGWTGVTGNIIFDKTYYLKTGYTTADFGLEGGSLGIVFETNYNGSQGNYPAGLRIGGQLPEWCGITQGNNTGSGEIERRVLTVSAQPSTVTRYAQFTVSAGNLTYAIKVTQSAGTDWVYISPPSGEFPINGSMQTLSLTISESWTMRVNDVNHILMTPETWDGMSSSAGSKDLKFYFKSGTAEGDKVILTFSTPDRSDKKVTITAVKP